ncbi:MAG: hypothetical protein ACQEUZ_15725 [Pseudomonadota bacterium]
MAGRTGREARRFLAHGLVFDSEVPAPWAHPAPPDRPADVLVRLGRARPGGAAAPAPSAWAVVSPSLAFGEWEGVRLRVEGGARVTMELAPGVGEAQAGLALVYAGALMILHQRGSPPLHAAAAAGPEGAALLIGGAGAGKSTFAAMLAARGMAPGADDLAALDWSGEGAPAVHAGPRTAKLFADSQAALGGAREVGAAGLGKAVVALEAGAGVSWPAPLRAVFALEWLHPPEAAPELERLRGAEALARLRAAVGRPELVGPMGLERRYFGLLARLAGGVPVFALRRPRRYEAFEEAAGLLHGALARQAAAARRENE